MTHNMTDTMTETMTQPVIGARLETPRGLPLLGHMLDYKHDPIGFLMMLSKEFGDVARFRLGPKDVYLVTHPEGIKDALARKQGSFAKSRAMEQAKRVLGNGLLTSEGKLHARQRRLMDPAFHRRQLARYAEVMVRHAGEVALRWRDGATVDIEAEMLHLALVVISETMFGADLAPDAHEISTALTDGMDFLMTIMLPFGSWLAKLPIPATRRFLRAQAKLDSTFYRIIERHEQKPAVEGEMDLLSMLIAARDDEDAAYKMPARQVRDEVMTIFLTGYETVGTALTWTFYLLAKHPQVQSALQKEIDATLGGRSPAFEDLPKLVFARRVLAESMRLFPPAWAVSRRVLEDVEVAGHTLAEGSIVLASQYVTQRDARFFPEPERFDPERWNGDAEAEKKASYSYFPFGAGGRSCIGERFAWTEATLLLAALSQRFSVRPVDDAPPKLMPLISLRPKGGLPLLLEARS